MGQRTRHENRVAAIKRRCDHLHERIAHWDRGNPDRTRAELAALAWALRLIEACDREGFLDELRGRGYNL